METSDYIALASMLIAFSALGTAFWQAYLAKEHNKLSVVPHLIVHTDTANGNCKFTLENNGLGPAIIKEFKLIVSGREISGFDENVYDKALCALGLEGNHTFYYPSEHEHISPTKLIDLYELDIRDCEDTKIAIITKNLKFRITYTSIYRDKDFEYFGNT